LKGIDWKKLQSILFWYDYGVINSLKNSSNSNYLCFATIFLQTIMIKIKNKMLPLSAYNKSNWLKDH
jgi:hypothetical protein